MLTYKKTVTTTEPRLVISYDNDTESPRNWSNLGYFFTMHSRYCSPDSQDNSLYRIILDTEWSANNSESHMQLIKKEAKEQGINIKAIYPVYCYDHSSIAYHRGTSHGWDISNCGFYIVTDETAKEFGAKRKDYEKVIDQELETYTKWTNGEVYQFILRDEQGNVVDACGGFYSLEDIREHLPKEYEKEDLANYFIS